MDEKAKLIGTAAQLVVPNVRQTAEYYVNVLGFQLIAYFFEEPPVYGMVVRDGFQVHFGKSDNGEVPLSRTIRKGMPDFLIWVPEIEAFYAEVTAKGATIAQEIIRRSYGKEFIIEDCDGHWAQVCD